MDGVLREKGASMGALTVILPDPLKKWLEEQVEGGGLADASSYVSALIAADRERRNEERLEALRRRLDESRASGVTTRTVGDIRSEGQRIARERGYL